ncbi:MAG TPA: outer membrane lipoprotein carrier protein LolA, partial [Thermoanaerobaculia bacterium]
MPTRRALLLAAAAVFASASAWGQNPSPTPPAASGALSAESAGAFARAAARYSDGSAHACPFVQIYTPAGFTTAKRESGTLWIQAPQRLRFDYEAPEKKTFTYDGGEGRLFTPEDKQLTIQKLTPEDRA